MIFNAKKFTEEPGVSVVVEDVTLAELSDYFVPRFQKDSHLDQRGIEEQIADPNTQPLTAVEAAASPARWNLDTESDEPTPIESLDIVPVATDLQTGKTLILDSNHTLVHIINSAGQVSHNSSIPVARIIGNDLSDIVPDFYILNRKA